MRDNIGTQTTSSSSSSPALDCDVALGLRMQLQHYPSSEPYSTKPMDLNLYRYRNANFTTHGSGGGGGDATFFTITGNQVAFVGGGMGKAVFTPSQWQELERQKTIHKYIMASIPVPPQLLLPTSTNSNSPPLSLSQSNNGVDLRFTSNGTDAEPWRCKRTDGKKWRCSRDVAPEQKYCERHAHKSRPRSRKHVESAAVSSSSSHNYNSYKNNTNTLQRSTSLFPTMAPSTPSTTTTTTTSYDQTRCIEWFMRGGTKQQQWQQLMQNKDIRTEEQDNNNVYRPQFEDKQGCLMSLNPYIPEPISHHQHQEHQLSNQNSILDKKIAFLPETQTTTTTATRHFFDAWGKHDFVNDEIGTSSSGNKFSPSSSLTLSMSAGNGIGEDHNNTNHHNNEENDQFLGIGMMMNHPVSWMNMNMNSLSTPGGPLGEALCPGNYASVTRGGTNLASPHRHGYSNNSNTNSSSCSEEGSYALNFIG